jgi:hypothetical protein
MYDPVSQYKQSGQKHKYQHWQTVSFTQINRLPYPIRKIDDKYNWQQKVEK